MTKYEDIMTKDECINLSEILKNADNKKLLNIYRISHLDIYKEEILRRLEVNNYNLKLLNSYIISNDKNIEDKLLKIMK